jgi:hypothetical protein
MANFTVINNGVVVNTILADSKEIAEEVTGLTCIEYEFKTGAPGIGWHWDGLEFNLPVE